MRSAAVAAVLRDAGRGPELLLIRRAERAGDPWSGDMAFPGGVVSAGDPGPFEAALREARRCDQFRARRPARLCRTGRQRIAVAHEPAGHVVVMQGRGQAQLGVDLGAGQAIAGGGEQLAR